MHAKDGDDTEDEELEFRELRVRYPVSNILDIAVTIGVETGPVLMPRS